MCFLERARRERESERERERERKREREREGEREKSWFFVTFNIFLRHIFPGNFIEILQVVQKI